MTTFVSLVNELLRRLNEVPLDTGGEGFGTVRNVQALAKDAINSSIREILQYNQEWPFTLTTYTQTLTEGLSFYSFPSNLSKVDWDSFYLKKYLNETTPQHLRVIDYTDYLRYYRPRDEVGGEAGYTVPNLICRSQEHKFGVTPIPDKAYEIEYKYWLSPADLVLYNDLTVIPARFKHVIIDGAMMYMMRFRSNDAQGEIHKAKFEKGINDMRSLLLDSPQYVSSTMIYVNNVKGNF